MSDRRITSVPHSETERHLTSPTNARPYSMSNFRSPGMSSRKSAMRSFKSHVVSVKLLDPDNIDETDLPATISEDDHTTFQQLFDALCHTTFRSHRGNEAAERGLQEIILTGKKMTEDHSIITVTPDILIGTIHSMYLHLDTIVFVMKSKYPQPVFAVEAGEDSSVPSPPASPTSTNRRSLSPKGFTHMRSSTSMAPESIKHFSYEDLNNARSYTFKTILHGDKGVYETNINSPEIEVTIEEEQTSLLDDVFISLCTSSFLPFGGEEAIQRGLLRVVIHGENKNGLKNEALTGSSSLSMMKYMFEKIDLIEFEVRSGIDEVKEEKALEKRKSVKEGPLDSVLGWTITKPIIHHPDIYLIDEDKRIKTVPKKIELSDFTNITFSDLFFVHCTSTFHLYQGEEAMNRGVAKIILSGIALDQGRLLEGGIAEGGTYLVEEFSHKSKVLSIRKVFQTLEKIEFFVKRFEVEESPSPLKYALSKKVKMSTISARYIRVQRMFNVLEHIHINQLEVFDQQGSKLKPIITNCHPQFGKTMNHGPQFLSDGHYEERDSHGRVTLTQTKNVADAYVELDLGKDCPISKVLIFNRVQSSSEALIGCALLLLNDDMQILFACPLHTSLCIYQIHTVPRKEQPVIPSEASTDTIELSTEEDQYLSTTHLPLLDTEQSDGVKGSTGSEKISGGFSWWRYLFWSCIPIDKHPDDLVLNTTPTTREEQQQEDSVDKDIESSIASPPPPPTTVVDYLTTFPSTWSNVIIGDYEVYNGIAKFDGGYHDQDKLDTYAGYESLLPNTSSTTVRHK